MKSDLRNGRFECQDNDFKPHSVGHGESLEVYKNVSDINRKLNFKKINLAANIG